MASLVQLALVSLWRQWRQPLTGTGTQSGCVDLVKRPHGSTTCLDVELQPGGLLLPAGNLSHHADVVSTGQSAEVADDGRRYHLTEWVETDRLSHDKVD